MNKKIVVLYAIVAAMVVGGIRCDYLSQIIADAQTAPPTTKEKMMGVWQVTEAYDENGVSILNDINFPVTVVHLGGQSSLESTAGPMFLEIVYGKNNYVNILNKMNTVFNYANLTLTDGGWFIEGGYPDRFTVEVALDIPGLGPLTSLLNTFGIAKNYLDVTVWHKFMDVSVAFDSLTDSTSTMTWEFDNQTTAVYNTKDSKGQYILWGGWPTTSFGHFKFVFTKRLKTVQQLIKGE